MYYLPTSYLVLFFFFFFSLIHHLPCDASNNTIGHKSCDHQSVGFHCNKSTTSLSISDKEFKVLHINQTSNTLRLVRTDHLGSFCSSTFSNTTLPPDIFELSPTYKSVTVFYDCIPFRLRLSRYKCPKLGFIALSENPNQYYDVCLSSFTVNVPTSFVTKENELIMTDLQIVLRNGFEVKVKIDEKKICGFNEILPLGVTCGPLHPPPTGKFLVHHYHFLISYQFYTSNKPKIWSMSIVMTLRPLLRNAYIMNSCTMWCSQKIL